MLNYLILDILIIIFPLLFSFKWKFKYYKYFKPLAASIFVVGLTYIIWDILVTMRGDWSFNEEFLSGIYLPTKEIGLPIEEIMFFIVVPFACIFIYENLVYFVKDKKIVFNKWFYLAIAAIFIIAGLVFRTQEYTILAMFSCALFFILAPTLMPNLLRSMNYWLYIILSFIPFIIFNYLLTSLIVVSYNPNAIWGGDGAWNGRFFTIPFEDFFYNFAMLSFYLMIYLYFKKKWVPSKDIKNGEKKMLDKKVIIVGSGFGGLAAAGLLARDGYDVTVIEKNEQAGGRASIWKKDGFTFDMGPSWYLMPDVFEKYFAEFDKKPEDYMKLVRLDPSYRVFFSKDDFVDVSADLEKNLDLFEKLEPGAKEKMKEYLKLSEYEYDIAMKDFIYKDYKHLTDFFKPKLIVEGTKLHMFKKLDDFAQIYFKSDKIRKILEYTIVFLGGSPYDSPALYSLMSHVDFNMGVWFPKGGMGKLVEAMQKIAEEEGAKFIFNEPVEKIIVENDIATGVKTKNKTYNADIIVVNADYAWADINLLDKKNRSYSDKYWDKRKIAPSAYLLYLGLDKKIKRFEHHNLYFHPKWVEHFDDIFKDPKWPKDFSYYVSCITKTDPKTAPKGCENVFVLIPVAPGLEDTEKTREKYYEITMKHMEELAGENLRDHVILKRIFAHNDFSNRYNAYKGTALGLAHTLKQTAIFRPKHESKNIKNLYYTGHYNHPGIGVPMVIISSQILRDVIDKKEKKILGE